MLRQAFRHPLTSELAISVLKASVMRRAELSSSLLCRLAGLSLSKVLSDGVLRETEVEAHDIKLAFIP